MSEPLQTLTYAPFAQASPGQVQHVSPLNFESTLARLEAAIEAEGLWILHQIDPQRLLARGGYAILPARQILFFHPRFAARILEQNPNGLMEAPLKLVVLQWPDGRVTVSHPAVEPSFARHPGLDTLGAELSMICRRVLVSLDVRPSLESTSI